MHVSGRLSIVAGASACLDNASPIHGSVSSLIPEIARKHITLCKYNRLISTKNSTRVTVCQWRGNLLHCCAVGVNLGTLGVNLSGYKHTCTHVWLHDQ